jgi:hypothetical protein
MRAWGRGLRSRGSGTAGGCAPRAGGAVPRGGRVGGPPEGRAAAPLPPAPHPFFTPPPPPTCHTVFHHHTKWAAQTRKKTATEPARALPRFSLDRPSRPLQRPHTPSPAPHGPCTRRSCLPGATPAAPRPRGCWAGRPSWPPGATRPRPPPAPESCAGSARRRAPPHRVRAGGPGARGRRAGRGREARSPTPAGPPRPSSAPPPRPLRPVRRAGAPGRR